MNTKGRTPTHEISQYFEDESKSAGVFQEDYHLLVHP